MGYRFKGKKPGKGHYVYTLNLKGGKKYVGYSSNVKKRIAQHFKGQGAAVTKECKPVSVHSVKRCRSKQKAKNAERIVYHNMKNYHGSDKVRGAGNTKRFSLSQPGKYKKKEEEYDYEEEDDEEEEDDYEYEDGYEENSDVDDQESSDAYEDVEDFNFYDSD